MEEYSSTCCTIIEEATYFTGSVQSLTFRRTNPHVLLALLTVFSRCFLLGEVFADGEGCLPPPMNVHEFGSWCWSFGITPNDSTLFREKFHLPGSLPSF